MQFFVAIIDHKLFEQIVFIIFETEKIQNSQMFPMNGALFALLDEKLTNSVIDNKKIIWKQYLQEYLPSVNRLSCRWAMWRADRKAFGINCSVCELLRWHPNRNQILDNSIYCRIWSNNLIKHLHLVEWVPISPATLKANVPNYLICRCGIARN